MPTRDGLRDDNHPLFRELGALYNQEAHIEPSEKSVPPWSVTKCVVRCAIGDQAYAHTPLRDSHKSGWNSLVG